MEISIVASRSSMPMCIDVQWTTFCYPRPRSYVVIISSSTTRNNNNDNDVVVNEVEEWLLTIFDACESSIRFDTTGWRFVSPEITVLGYQDDLGRGRTSVLDVSMHKIVGVGTASLAHAVADAAAVPAGSSMSVRSSARSLSRSIQTPSLADFNVVEVTATVFTRTLHREPSAITVHRSTRPASRPTSASGRPALQPPEQQLSQSKLSPHQNKVVPRGESSTSSSSGFLSRLRRLFCGCAGRNKSPERDQDSLPPARASSRDVIVSNGSLRGRPVTPNAGPAARSCGGAMIGDMERNSVRSIRSTRSISGNNNVVKVGKSQNANADPSKRYFIRFGGTGVPFIDVTVTCSLDESTTRLTATVNWTFQGLETPDSWQVTVVNRTWSQGDNCTYHQWLFIADKGTTSFKLPVWLQPGNGYRISVRGLKRRNEPHSVIAINAVICKGSALFRAGTVLTMEDMERLLDNACYFIRNNKGQKATKCHWLYRNKPKKHFEKILKENNGLMTGFLKDAGGDSQSPINGELSGLFFGANAQKNGKPLDRSPFGDTRLLVSVYEMLDRAPNVYFADFYCMLPDGLHYAILVLTKPSSAADVFCRTRLPRLSLDDSVKNPFLHRQQDGQMIVAKIPCLVEVFYTEDLDLNSCNSRQIQHDIELIKAGTSAQGGKLKYGRCSQCNVVSKQFVRKDLRLELF